MVSLDRVCRVHLFHMLVSTWSTKNEFIQYDYILLIRNYSYMGPRIEIWSQLGQVKMYCTSLTFGRIALEWEGVDEIFE